ncbi:MAG: SPFH domain-containing protein [Oscillospiraceae bacterium]|nr:SPFH domain-containing protein [Oscillospiraceae bacterium]
MGLIKAALGALGGTLADQWKEFFSCDALDKDVLAVKGQKRIGGRSSNTKGSDNVISNGSGVVVADGQCMIIVEQGKIVEFCAEPGEYTYKNDIAPSLFSGSFGQSLKQTFKEIGKRFAYGGEPAVDQRVYYFNTKEILDNKFGTPNPIPFRILDRNIGLDMDTSVRCNGVYSYKMVNPLLFYTNVCGNVTGDYRRQEIDSQLKAEFVSALQPSFAKISDLGIRPSGLPAHVTELCDAMNMNLSQKWGELRGLQIVSIGMNPPSIPAEDEKILKDAQRTAILRDPTMAAATLVGSQSDAMKAAANNSAGAMTGFMGFGMAQQAGGINAQSLFQMGQQQQAPTTTAPVADGWKCACGNTAQGKFCPECGAKKPEPQTTGWKCACGAVAEGKFCPECGAKKPEDGWTCTCGAVCKGKFCPECGAKKPEGAPLYRCDKCGWEPSDPKNPPKFCPECGDLFNDADKQ